MQTQISRVIESLEPRFLLAGAPQTIGLNFLGPELSVGSAIEPDSAGAVGPTQVLLAVEGSIKTFSKSTGLADGALFNTTTDSFFNSVRGGASTNYPQVRFDRQSGRWFVCMSTNATPNRILLAVSNTSTITNVGSFTFFQFQQDLIGTTPNSDTGGIVDSPKLGVDNSALYIGTNIFNAAGTTYIGATGFVIRKSSLLSGGPLVVTAFRQIGTSASGMFSPVGVNNDDSNAAEGYFVGVDGTALDKLVIRRVSSPGGTPTISGDINLTVPATDPSIIQPANGSNVGLRLIDHRLTDASIHRNKITGAVTLWTAHHTQVDSTGIASLSGGRNGSRWYEIENLNATPDLRQSGTLFDSAASNPRGFFVPSINENGQGAAAIGISTASAVAHADVAVAGRLRTDKPGLLQPFTAATASGTAFNPTINPPYRWGDYSATVVDPQDDMTFWTFQEYCSALNSWGVRVVQLKSPRPATPASVDSSIAQGDSNVNITVTGNSTGGFEFFDPGADYANHISASVAGTGVTVNSTTFTDPTHVTLNLSVAAGAAVGMRMITVTNPDGQFTTSTSSILTITPAAPAGPDMDTASDAGVSSSDNITNVATPGFSGTVAAGAIVTLLLDGNPIGTDSTTIGGTYEITPAAAIADGNHAVTATATLSGITSAPSAGITVRIDTVAPSVSPVSLNYNPSQFLTYSFTEDVSQTLLSTAHCFVTNLNTAIPAAVLGSLTGFPNLVKYTFTGGLLADGNYVASISESGVTDVAGNGLTGAGTEYFFFLNADANRDRAVNALDFNAIATNFGLSGDFAHGNFDYSGIINTDDFNLLATRFNKVLAMASPPPPAAAAAIASVFSNRPIDSSPLELLSAGEL